MVYGDGGDGDSATPSDTDPGLLMEFKPVLSGLSQAFKETWVTYFPQPIYNPSALTFVPHMCKAMSAPRMGSLAVLRRGADAKFSLMFEARVAGLRPMLEIDKCPRMRAATIFEKEQEYMVEATQPAQSRVRQELYTTENGCMFILYLSCAQFPDTDSPEGSSALVYRPSPFQHPYDTLLHLYSDSLLGPAALAGAGEKRRPVRL